MWNEFENHKSELFGQYSVDNWQDGQSPEVLKENVYKILSADGSTASKKAAATAYILKNARIVINENEFFQDMLDHQYIMQDFL